MADPRMNPATTSEQWFRYSETRFSPARKAEQSVPRQSTGLASRLDLVLMVLVMYIWRRSEYKKRKSRLIQIDSGCCIAASALVFRQKCQKISQEAAKSVSGSLIHSGPNRTSQTAGGVSDVSIISVQIQSHFFNVEVLHQQNDTFIKNKNKSLLLVLIKLWVFSI